MRKIFISAILSCFASFLCLSSYAQSQTTVGEYHSSAFSKDYQIKQIGQGENSAILIEVESKQAMAQLFISGGDIIRQFVDNLSQTKDLFLEWAKTGSIEGKEKISFPQVRLLWAFRNQSTASNPFNIELNFLTDPNDGIPIAMLSQSDIQDRSNPYNTTSFMIILRSEAEFDSIINVLKSLYPTENSQAEQVQDTQANDRERRPGESYAAYVRRLAAMGEGLK